MKLLFRQPDIKRYQFEITQDTTTDNDQSGVVGTLSYAKVRHNQANAGMGNETWSFKRKTLGGIVISDSETQRPIATYRKPFFSRVGVIALGNDRYNFGPSRTTHGSHSWTDSAGTELVTYADHTGIKRSGEILIAETTQKPQEDMLIPLGLFMKLNQQEDAATAVTGVIAG